MLLSTSMVSVTTECQIISSSTLFWELLVLWLTSSWNSCHQLRVCNLCFPLLQTYQTCSCQIYSLFTAKKPPRRKLEIGPSYGTVSLTSSVPGSVPVCISVPPPPRSWCETLRWGYHLLIWFVQRALQRVLSLGLCQGLYQCGEN